MEALKNNERKYQHSKVWFFWVLNSMLKWFLDFICDAWFQIVHKWTPCHREALKRSHVDKTIVLLKIGDRFVPIVENAVQILDKDETSQPSSASVSIVWVTHFSDVIEWCQLTLVSVIISTTGINVASVTLKRFLKVTLWKSRLKWRQTCLKQCFIVVTQS